MSMENELIKIFKKAKYEPDANLALDVWRAVMARNEEKARLKLWTFSILGLFSLAGLVPVLEMLISDFAHSGFYEYFSLIFPDGASIASSWKELMFSLAESLPTVSVMLTLSLVFVFFFSIRHAMQQVGKNRLALGNFLAL